MWHINVQKWIDMEPYGPETQVALKLWWRLNYIVYRVVEVSGAIATTSCWWPVWAEPCIKNSQVAGVSICLWCLPTCCTFWHRNNLILEVPSLLPLREAFSVSVSVVWSDTCMVSKSLMKYFEVSLQCEVWNCVCLQILAVCVISMYCGLWLIKGLLFVFLTLLHAAKLVENLQLACWQCCNMAGLWSASGEGRGRGRGGGWGQRHLWVHNEVNRLINMLKRLNCGGLAVFHIHHC